MWINSAIPMLDVVDRLRAGTVPSGYTPHPWTPGIYVKCTHPMYFTLCLYIGYFLQEGLKEKLRFIMAQFEFQHILKQWEERGVNFRMYMYVPEIYPETRDYFCEREDEAHVLKVGDTDNPLGTLAV